MLTLCPVKLLKNIVFCSMKGTMYKMNQIKIGNFIRELRKEKGFTQEQFAEHFNVSRRTVSRWETGNNLPDLDILIELADYCEVELRELLDGERKKENTENKLEETVLKVAEFSNEKKQIIMKRMNKLFIGGLIASIVFLILRIFNCSENFLGGLCEGIMFTMMVIGIIFTSKLAEKIYSSKF